MENDQETNKTEEKNDATTEEVKADETPVESNVEKAKNGENHEEKKESETVEATPELLEKIKKQIEFYFGDVNMQKDKFLIEQTKLSDGWVPMDVMLKFKLLAALSKDSVTIVNALESSELIEVSEDKSKIRRSLDHPLPVYDEEYRKSQQERTIYAKGFPLEGITIDMLKDFFAPYEPIENIYMRKYADKEKKMHFKGSIFVQFKTLDAAKNFMEKDSFKYEETELIRKWAVDYNAEKLKERDERRQKKESQKGNKNSGGQEKKEETEKGKETRSLPKGSILHLSGIESGAREDIKEALANLDAHVAFVDYSRGKESGYVRLVNENEAKTIFEKLEEGKLKIAESEANVRVLEGEEEIEYLAKVEKELANLRKGKYNKHGNSKGGRKNRFQRGQKRKGNDFGDEISPKKKAV
ncbi:la protein homolog [Leptopilina boulardi]|uniref:la protein homolog n=1 Tax=Leptopilina boulardi TaxID=63433 RepID=UPI0021F62AA3|nr:la protein homolog [Leptopilina boulardi]